MNFIVSHAGREGPEPFANYIFHVELNGQRVADIAHDYRGGEHWIRKPVGPWVALAAGPLQGGGQQPVELTEDGVEAVRALI